MIFSLKIQTLHVLKSYTEFTNNQPINSQNIICSGGAISQAHLQVPAFLIKWKRCCEHAVWQNQTLSTTVSYFVDKQTSIDKANRSGPASWLYFLC